MPENHNSAKENVSQPQKRFSPSFLVLFLSKHPGLWGLTTFLLSRLLPKKEKLVIFTAEYGKGFFGNPRAVFEHMVKSKEGYTPMWLSSDPKLLGKLETRFPGKVVQLHSLKGLGLLASARHIIIHKSVDFQGVFFNPKKQKIIQCWHGIPLKRIQILQTEDQEKKEIIREHSLKYYSAIISTSPKYSELISQCFGVSPEMTPITGYPRNDLLFQETDSRAFLWELLPELPKFQRLILYAPTFRDDGSPVRLFPFDDFRPHELGELLERTKSLLLINHHVGDAARKEYGSLPKRVIFAPQGKMKEKLLDGQYLLGASDVLITDYSSIYFDYLLVDRPMIFLPYDLESYREQRGFVLDYEDYTPGPKPGSFGEFMKALERALAGEDGYGQQREKIRKEFHSFRDDGSSRRVEELLKRL